jgi:hypothetical protein
MLVQTVRMRLVPARADPYVLALSVLVAAAGWIVHAVVAPPDTYWTIDNGGKALVLANLREDPGRTWIEYPGRRIDPELRWFPQPLDGAEPYGVRRDGRVVSQYASPFVWLTLPFAAALGFRGLAVLPALAAGAAVLLTGGLAARRAGAAAGRDAATVLALATPLLFYASVFWEHAVVTALAAGAFATAAGRPRPLAAGLLAGAAGLLREECFLLAAAIAVAIAAAGGNRRLPRFLAGAAAGALAALAFQKLVTGAWTGVHVGVNRPVPFVHAADALRGLLLGTGSSGVPVALVALPIAALAAGRWLRERAAAAARTLTAAGAAALAAIAATALLRFPGGGDEALALIRSNSALLFVPWVLCVPFLPARTDRGPGPPRDVLAWAPLLFVAAFVVLVPERSITGVHPGPRMLLPALPAAAVLLAERFPRRRLPAAAVAIALVVSTAWTAQSLRLLHDKRHAASELTAAIAADPHRVVATDLFWLPTELAVLWDRKEFHLVRGPEDLAALGARAAAAGDREILAVTTPGAPGAVRTVAHPRLPEFAAALHVRTAPERGGGP